MATEIRRILFSDKELLGLVSDYINAENGRFEPGKVLDLRQIGEEPLVFEATVQTIEGPQTHITFKSEDLTAVVLHHLMSRKIPVPRKADKHVARAKNGLIALDMVIGML